MKKYTLLMIIGGLFLIIGVIIFSNKKKETVYYVEEDSMKEEEIVSLITEKVKTIIEVYENQGNTFKINKDQDESSEYLEVLNYNDVIDKLYTEEGKKELEKIKFNNKLFVNKDEETTYILKALPENNLYSNCSISVSNATYNKGIVKGVVSLTKNVLGNNEVLTYYVYEKNIELIKKDDKWLIKTFIYSNV